jgi:hypothetical protein
MDICFITTIMFSENDLNKLVVDLVKFLMCLCRRMTGVVFLEFVNKENTNMVYDSKFLEVLDSNFTIPHTKLYGATTFLNLHYNFLG